MKLVWQGTKLALKNVPSFCSSRFFVCNFNQARCCSGKYLVKYRNIKNPNQFNEVVWVEPENIKPWDVRRTGDLEARSEIDGCRPCQAYEKLPEYLVANDVVKKLASVHYNGKQEELKLFKQDLLGRVQRYEGDEESLESRIALYTARIRNQHIHHAFVPTDKSSRYLCKLFVDRRRRLLNSLRLQDYRRYEWVLERLNIVHRLDRHHDVPTERDQCMKELVRMHVDEVKERKLRELQEQFKSEQKVFLKEKERALQHLNNEKQTIEQLSSEVETLAKKLSTECFDL